MDIQQAKYVIKLVIYGNSKSGKTTYLNKLSDYLKGCFKIPTYDDFIKVFKLDTNIGKIELKIWDIYGLHKKFNSDMSVLCNDADGAIVMLDSTSNLPETNVINNVYRNWIFSLKHGCQNIPFVMCSTKHDNSSFRKFDSLDKNVGQFEISSKRNHNIIKPLESIISTIVSDNVKIKYEKIPHRETKRINFYKQ